MSSFPQTHHRPPHLFAATVFKILICRIEQSIPLNSFAKSIFMGLNIFTRTAMSWVTNYIGMKSRNTQNFKLLSIAPHSPLFANCVTRDNITTLQTLYAYDGGGADKSLYLRIKGKTVTRQRRPPEEGYTYSRGYEIKLIWKITIIIVASSIYFQLERQLFTAAEEAIVEEHVTASSTNWCAELKSQCEGQMHHYGSGNANLIFFWNLGNAVELNRAHQRSAPP